MSISNDRAYVALTAREHALRKNLGLVQIGDELRDSLNELVQNLRLALDCIEIFGAVPMPVAKAVFRNIEPAQAAIDMAIRSSEVQKGGN